MPNINTYATEVADVYMYIEHMSYVKDRRRDV